MHKSLMYLKLSLTILGMIVGVATTGIVTALSMSETALAAGTGGGCGVGGCGGDFADLTGSGITGGVGRGGGSGEGGSGVGLGIGFGDNSDTSVFSHCGLSVTKSGTHGSCFD